MAADVDAGQQAKETYEAFAASYDDFNHLYKYERWTGVLLEAAEAAGLEGRRLLDVGCGTGLSFVAMPARGFEVTGCDISPAMLAQARIRADRAAILVEADMRDLPRLGEFDLVWAVNDAINYLLTATDLRAALTGMRRNLGPGGIVLFDVNTLATYRGFFGDEVVVERAGRRLVWHGQAPGNMQSGAMVEATFDGSGEGVNPHLHRQRHFAEPTVRAAIEDAGLECIVALGERNGDLTPGVEEKVDTKAVYICRATRLD
jgi:SAM-dependent methyltransferase